MKYAERESRHAKLHQQFPEPERRPAKGKPEKPMERQKREYIELRPRDLTWKGLTPDDVFRYIVDPQSQELCQTVVDCDGNLSEAGRRLRMPESTVRHRLKMLGPKLLAAGFNPYRTEDA
jgi:transcriptional regulator of acetoin/glycerol metabolism